MLEKDTYYAANRQSSLPVWGHKGRSQGRALAWTTMGIACEQAHSFGEFARNNLGRAAIGRPIPLGRSLRSPITDCLAQMWACSQATMGTGSVSAWNNLHFRFSWWTIKATHLRVYTKAAKFPPDYGLWIIRLVSKETVALHRWETETRRFD